MKMRNVRIFCKQTGSDGVWGLAKGRTELISDTDENSLRLF